MKILKWTGTEDYLEKMEVGEHKNHLAIFTPHKREAMEFESDLQIGYFIAKCGFKLDQFEVVDCSSGQLP